MVQLPLVEAQQRAGRERDRRRDVSRALTRVDRLRAERHVKVTAQLVGRGDGSEHLPAARANALANGQSGLGERRHDVVAGARLVEVGVEGHLGVGRGGGLARDLRTVSDQGRLGHPSPTAFAYSTTGSPTIE